jgi:hypothetical protein
MRTGQNIAEAVMRLYETLPRKCVRKAVPI